jgi:hypothetical protein
VELTIRPDSSQSCPVPHPSAPYNASATNHQALALNPSPSFLSTHTADSVGNPSDPTALSLSNTSNSKLLTALFIVFPRWLSHRAQHLGRYRFTRPWSTITPQSSRPRCTEFSGLSGNLLSALRAPMAVPPSTVSPPIRHQWASVVKNVKKVALPYVPEVTDRRRTVTLRVTVKQLTSPPQVERLARWRQCPAPSRTGDVPQIPLLLRGPQLSHMHENCDTATVPPLSTIS